MPALLILIFKINFVLLLFTASYYLSLRKFTFHNLNRAYLLFGILFSTCYPFINLTTLFNQHQEKIPNIKAVVESLQVVKEGEKPFVNFWSIIVVVILIGVIAFLTRLFIQLFSLYQIHIKAKTDFCNDITIKKLEGQVNPFSFWRNIYINPNLYSTTELENILKHEQIHVKELHTLDILIAEVATVFYWFNPGVWLMKKAIKENIEFITDAKILKAGADKKTYQYSLLTVNNLQLRSNLVNSFNFSDIKTRIKMMNKGKSAKSRIFIYAFVCPLIIAICLLFTISILKKETVLTQKIKIAENLIAPSQANELSLMVVKKQHSTEVPNPKKVKPLAQKPSKMQELKSAANATQQADTNYFNPKTLLVKLNQISDAINKTKDKLDTTNITMISVKVDRKVEPVAGEISKIVFIDIKDATVFNERDSSHITYYLNGQVINKSRLANYEPNQIKSITIKKDKIVGTGIIIETNN